MASVKLTIPMQTNHHKTTILYLITLAENGGAQKYVYDLCSYLQDKFNIIVASSGNQNDWLPKNLQTQKISWLKLSWLKRNISPFNDLKAIQEILKLIDTVKPNLIHLNSSKISILGSVAAKLRKVPCIYTAHGWVFNEPLSLPVKKIYLLAEKITANFKDKIICVSEFDRQTAINNGFDPAQLITIHNGIATDQINRQTTEDAKANLLAKLNLPANASLIGAIANLYPTKNISSLIQAAAKLCSQNQNLIFVVIGDGPEKNKLNQLINRYRLNKNFILTGAINQASRLLPAFDLFVLPSLKEGLPYTLLEAMATGLPIVASGVGGVPEILQKNYPAEYFKLVKPNDISQLTRALSEMINKNKLLTDHLETVRKNIDINQMIAATKRVYEEIISDRM